MSYHRVREAVAGGWLRFEHIPGTENPSDILTKPLAWFQMKVFVEPLLLWKGDTSEIPSAESPEGSDTSPGQSTRESVNHGRDSTDGGSSKNYQSDPAGTPAGHVLGNNQYFALMTEDD